MKKHLAALKLAEGISRVVSLKGTVRLLLRSSLVLNDEVVKNATFPHYSIPFPKVWLATRIGHETPDPRMMKERRRRRKERAQ